MVPPLEEKSENRAIAAWIYKEETLVDLTEQSREITCEKYDPGLKLMKRFGYKGIGPIGCNKNGLVDPIKEIARRNWNTSSLGFKKIPFHLGINKFIPELESSSEHESQTKSDNHGDDVDNEDPYPYPIPDDLAKFFIESDDFVPHVNTMDGDSDSSDDTIDSHHTQLEQGESSHNLVVEQIFKNPNDEGEFLPIIVGEF